MQIEETTQTNKNIRVETHFINANHEFFKDADDLCFKSKLLYNKANFICRQAFVDNEQTERKWVRYYDLDKALKSSVEYKALPSKVAQQTLQLLDRNWKSFFESMKEWKKNKSKFKGMPRVPKFKDKGTKGRQIVIYSNQAISVKELKKNGKILLSKTKISIPFINKDNCRKLCEARIVPQTSGYKIEIVYEHKEKEKEYKPETTNVCSIDLGVNNLMTITFNQPGMNPLLIKGGYVKSTNQFFNKNRSLLMSQLPTNQRKSKRIDLLTQKRNNKLSEYFHLTSRRLIEHCIKNNIDTILIGYNEGWKQNVNNGKRNNQNFCSIPYKSLIDKISYKAKQDGIRIILQEESYTSKCSFLDNEDMIHKEKYLGTRRKRGLYISANGREINADVNGSYNIMRKAFPDIIEGIEAPVVVPRIFDLRKSNLCFARNNSEGCL